MSENEITSAEPQISFTDRLNRMKSCPATTNVIKSCIRCCDGNNIKSYGGCGEKCTDDCCWSCLPCALIIDIVMCPIRFCYDYKC